MQEFSSAAYSAWSCRAKLLLPTPLPLPRLQEAGVCNLALVLELLGLVQVFKLQAVVTSSRLLCAGWMMSLFKRMLCMWMPETKIIIYIYIYIYVYSIQFSLRTLPNQSKDNVMGQKMQVPFSMGSMAIINMELTHDSWGFSETPVHGKSENRRRYLKKHKIAKRVK